MISSSLKNKIGQLFLIGFSGAELTDDHPIVSDLCDRGLGGVILFDRLLATKAINNNIIDSGQVRRLTDALRQFGGDGLLIGVDQEGGLVNRFKAARGFPQFPSAAELGAHNDVSRTRQAAGDTAAMLRSLGINWSLSPVVDLAVNQDNPIIAGCKRSFGKSWQHVADHARAWIEAHRDCGIGTCLKHFPGHGSSAGDSHLGFVDISECWRKQELEPFRFLIDHRLADAVMVGHLYHAGLDPDYPASLSYPIITTILREELGFNGLVVADDLQMQAISDHYSLSEACCRAINGGCDLLIIGNNLKHDPHILAKAIDGIVKGLADGTVQQTQIESSWLRVQDFKKRLR